jgi:uncharacterized membrane protein
MEAGKVGDKCPACGVPAKLFEPYIPTISEKRSRILKIHLHPVIVHAPQSFALFIFLFAVLYLLTDGSIKSALLGAVAALSISLPIVVIGAIGSGLLDGKIRLRKVTTPILVKKIIIGSFYLIFSLVMLLVILFSSLENTTVAAVFLAGSVGCIICSTVLGLLGASLLDSQFPG